MGKVNLGLLMVAVCALCTFASAEEVAIPDLESGSLDTFLQLDADPKDKDTVLDTFKENVYENGTKQNEKVDWGASEHFEIDGHKEAETRNLQSMHSLLADFRKHKVSLPEGFNLTEIALLRAEVAANPDSLEAHVAMRTRLEDMTKLLKGKYHLVKNVRVVKFVGVKHVRPRKPFVDLNFTKPTVFDDSIIFRKAREILKDVVDDYPDHLRDTELSPYARCVDSDPYFPDYVNPIGLKNPSHLRSIARRGAEAATKRNEDIHVGVEVMIHSPTSIYNSSVEGRPDSKLQEIERLNDLSSKNIDVVNSAYEVTREIARDIQLKLAEKKLQELEKMKQESVEEGKKVDEGDLLADTKESAGII